MKTNRLFTIIAIVSIVIILVIVTAVPSLAFQTHGYVWYTGYVTYNAGALDSTYQSAVSSAANTWTNCGAYFSFASGSSWNYMSEYDYGNVGWDGTTQKYLDQSGLIDEVTTCFNTYSGYSSDDKQTIALHEFGHWLELNDDPYDGTSVVMYPGYTGVKRSLAQDDIDGIEFLYGP